MQKEKALPMRNGPQPVRIESLPLDEALKVLDTQGRAQVRGGSVRVTPLAEELMKSKKIVLKDKKDQTALNNFYRVFAIWACERAKAYHRALYPNGQLPKDEDDIDMPTKTYYTALHDQIIYVVQEQSIFKPEFLAMRVGFDIRNSLLRQLSKLKRDPREQKPLARRFGPSRQENTLPQYRKLVGSYLVKLISGDIISSDYYADQTTKNQHYMAVSAIHGFSNEPVYTQMSDVKPTPHEVDVTKPVSQEQKTEVSA